MYFLQRKGYALILVLSCISFLTLSFIGLSTYISLQTKTWHQQNHNLSAKNNAQLALSVALKNLQTFLGPNARISAYKNKENPSWLGVWDSYGYKPDQNTKDRFITYLGSGYQSKTQKYISFSSIPKIPLLLNDNSLIGHYAYEIIDESTSDSPHSYGIPSNTITGTLKKDLTLIFEKEFFPLYAFQPIFTKKSPNETLCGPLWDILYSYYHLYHNDFLLPNISQRNYITSNKKPIWSYNSIEPRSFFPFENRIPKFQHLSQFKENFFLNLPGFDSQFSHNRNDPVINAINPIPIDFKIKLALHSVPSKKNSKDDFNLVLTTTPEITLLNPYNQSLKNATYKLEYELDLNGALLAGSKAITVRSKLNNPVDAFDDIFNDMELQPDTPTSHTSHSSTPYIISSNGTFEFKKSFHSGQNNRYSEKSLNPQNITTDTALKDQPLSINITSIKNLELKLYLYKNNNIPQLIWDSSMTPFKNSFKPISKNMGLTQNILGIKNKNTFIEIHGHIHPSFLNKNSPILNQTSVRSFRHKQKQNPTLWSIQSSIKSTLPLKNTVLFNIPKQPLVSIGELMHANISYASDLPTYLIGNPYHEISQELNQVLFDDYFFTTETIINNDLLIKGAFNINSTSENAWTQLLKKQNLPARIATKIVKEIEKHGPFMSLSHFINSAILHSACQDENINPIEILSKISPILSARSDTFKVKAYGDSINPKTEKIESKAWCEAIVQRICQKKDAALPYKFIVTQFQWVH